ncbi:hypothetical protein OSB04_031185 [Centaurea solstitialis]|uniref:Uncharacterized protein n=1 Tax=Centaurea solstitialis TaxID=347529 RepID=A0AA38SSJ2_9ASTR|nr:hypothetical protein OSB04_031185 [Centaurea solstitialis]
MFMGHQRSLPKSHPYCKFKELFDGKTEHGVVRPPLHGVTIYSRVQDLDIVLAKKVQLLRIFGKRSLFFGNYHIGSTCKCDIVLMLCILKRSLFLNIPGKTKDGVKVRKDMVEMGIRSQLAPVETGKSHIPTTNLLYIVKSREN